jgi:ribosomal protein S18 acetylase RimI-like enzyme
MLIRRAKKEDIDAITTIHVRTWQAAYKGQMPDELLANLSYEKRRRTWKKIIADPKSNLLVTEVDGQVRGFCGGGKSRDKDASKSVAEIYSIYLDHTFFGKGLGKALLKKMEKLLEEKGFDTATLWVLTTNEKARRFYEKQGYVLDGKEKTIQKDNFDFYEVRYAKNLT